MKIRFKIPSWGEGRRFMKQCASILNTNIMEVDADLFIEHPECNISCHFDDRGFSFVIIKQKLENENLKQIYQKYIS